MRGLHHWMQVDEGSTVARRTTLACSGSPVIPHRSCYRGRWLRFADGRVVLRAKQVPKLVKKLRTVKKMRKEVDRWLGVSWTRRKWIFSPTAVADLRRRNRAAWWLPCSVVWGKGERAVRCLSRSRREQESLLSTPVLKNAIAGVSCHGRARD